MILDRSLKFFRTCIGHLKSWRISSSETDTSMFLSEEDRLRFLVRSICQSLSGEPTVTEEEIDERLHMYRTRFADPEDVLQEIEFDFVNLRVK